MPPAVPVPPPVPGAVAARPTTRPVLTVTRVIDGDTLTVSDGNTVRLIGIDTPERRQCGYRDATLNLECLAGSETVARRSTGRALMDPPAPLVGAGLRNAAAREK